MWQQMAGFTRPLRRQACEHVLQIGIRIMPIQPRRLDQLMIAAARFPLRSDRAKSQFYVQEPKGGSGCHTSCYLWVRPRHQGSAIALPSVSGCNRVLADG